MAVKGWHTSGRWLETLETNLRWEDKKYYSSKGLSTDSPFFAATFNFQFDTNETD
jgi:hypothetical protein